MNTTLVEKKAKLELLEKTWNYLNDNFHKFTEVNKIKIALALNLRDMVSKIEGDLGGHETKIIIIKNGNKTEEVSRGVSVQPGEVPSTSGGCGDGQDTLPTA